MRTCALLLAAAILAPAPAGAMSCIHHAWETMDVTLEGVTRDGEPVEAPPQLGTLDQLLNSSSEGESILFWEEETMGFAKFYHLEETFEPTPGVAAYIDSYSEWTLRTACKYTVRYTPILPGRYPFQEEHGDGSTTPKGIDDPVLVVPPDRETVTLEFSVGGVEYAARYRVTCAFFDWDKDRSRTCADTSPEVTLVDGEKVISPPPPPPVQPERSGCSSCAVTGSPDPASLALLAALGLAMLWGAGRLFSVISRGG